jgi:hypothetical protein
MLELYMTFSLKGFTDILDNYPEHKVLSVMMEQYEGPTKGVLFNEKFIPMSEMMILGYQGFKKFLYVLLETDETFLDTCLPELRALTLSLKGDGI